jgi:hypothetical protein
MPRAPISCPHRAFSLVLALSLLNGCTAMLWKDHEWHTTTVCEVTDEDGRTVTREAEEFNWGPTLGKLAVTPVTVALDAAAVGALIWWIAWTESWDDDEEEDC